MQNDLWGKVLSKLEKRINRPSFNTWLRPTSCVSVQQKQVCIGVPDDVFVYWLGEHYVHLMTDILAELLGFQPDISFTVVTAATDTALRHDAEAGQQKGHTHGAAKNMMSSQVASSVAVANFPTERRSAGLSRLTLPSTAIPQKPAPAAMPDVAALPTYRHAQYTGQPVAMNEPMAAPFVAPEKRAESRKNEASNGYGQRLANASALSLNSSYTFGSYIVGSGNRFAHAAALAVADQKAENYNPLFVYGGVGLGKTHLLHAIGNQYGLLRPGSRVLYLSSEQFINELVGSIREDRMTWFRDKYRTIDLLLVDDIQFIARKERTQEEFFHTFNTLYQAGKQIVLTSDCPPKKIPTIAEQLRSRFEWGLIADIQAPDLETRIAILRKKSDMQGIDLPDDVAIYIASNVRSNIRELEGCLSKIRAYATLHNYSISVALAQKVLTDLFDAPINRRVTLEMIQQVVARHYQIEPAEMTSSSRGRKTTLPRQIAMFLVRELTNLSLPDIGRQFGGRDHTTVMHACKKIESSVKTDTKLKEQIQQIRELINA